MSATTPVPIKTLRATAAVDSLVLAHVRKILHQEDRMAAIERSDRLLEQRLAHSRDLKKHVTLLHQMFFLFRSAAVADRQNLGLTGEETISPVQMTIYRFSAIASRPRALT